MGLELLGTPSGSNDEVPMENTQEKKKEILKNINPTPGCSLA